VGEAGAGWRVALTGASGSLGRRVVAALCADARVASVLALDRVPFPGAHAKLESRVCDVRDPDLARHFAGCDSVVHLAFIVERGSRDAAETEAINVGGTRNVCEAAARAGVGQIVYASSVAAYGFHADTDGVLLAEEAPLRGNDEFYYGRHKAANERWLDDFERRHPQVRVARLRPTIFLGEGSPRRAGALRGRLHVALAGPEPRVQITHEDDVAAAFVLAVAQRARGAFNVATEEPLTPREMGRAMGKRTLVLPRAVLSLHRLAWRLGRVDVDPIWFDVAGGRSLVVSGAKLRKELGWKPRFETSADVLRHLAGRPNAAASHAARAFFRPLVRLSRLLRGLPPRPEARAEARGMQGSVNLVLSGERPSEWHFSLREGRLHVGEGALADARATVSLRDRTFTDLLAGRLESSTAQMTGKIRLRGDGEMAFLVGALIEGFTGLRQARGWRGWPARRYAAWVLREADAAAAAEPRSPT
jgi:nucleoside-diphosphate-sugar epimerase